MIAILGARGLSLSWAQYLSDDPNLITATLRRTFAGNEVVFSTGGIGATPDDHTRQCAAAALGVGLHLHPEAERLITERIREMNQGVLSSDENRQRMKMGEFPMGANIIPNPYNRIPGFQLHEHYFVPGFPVMAWPMLEWVLDQYYADHFHRSPQAERALLVFHTAESSLTPLMEQVEASFPGIKVFSLPTVGITAPDGTRSRGYIELGVKGDADRVPEAFSMLRNGVVALNAPFEELTQ